jgi:hypothetical protein
MCVFCSENVDTRKLLPLACALIADVGNLIIY